MKIEINYLPESQQPPSLEQFADRHGLVMLVSERSARQFGRFYAHFKNCDTVECPGLLRGTSGNGDSPQQAIKDYSDRIAGLMLVIDAHTPARREIQSPQYFTPTA